MKYTNWLLATLLVGGLGTAVAGIASATQEEQKPKFNPFQIHQKIVKSKEGLLKYKKESENTLKKLQNEISQQEEVFVTITLAKPINEGQLTKLVNNYKLNVQHTLIRSIEKDTKLRGTLLMSPSEKGLFDKTALDRIMTQNDATFKGFIEIVATVPNANLQGLASDQLVFLVDSSGDEHFVFNPKKKYVPGVFWDLEDTNMISE
ncbi:hypothetical protein [Effusibacillus consociatus]|uniref:DUF4252 domain-containing protein n=1 Tax=Effusibacillus consociatus TaxID=1117041 RepID=A0ABV9PZ37_9BACL